MGSIPILLLLVAVGVTMAYVSPDDPSTDPRDVRMSESRTVRPKPKPLSPQTASSESSRRKRGPNVRRKSRDTGSSAGSGGFATSGSFSGSGGGGNYHGVGSGNIPTGFGFSGSGLPGGNFPNSYPFHNPNPSGIMPFDFNSLFQYLQQMQQAFQQNAVNQGYSNNGLGGNFMDNGGNYNNMGSFGNSGSGYGDGASAVASIGPQGGYGSASLIPDLGTRFGSDSGRVPPPNGGNVGVFSSSSSGTSDVNGQRTSYKTATSGINDNGKVTTFTVRDPPQK